MLGESSKTDRAKCRSYVKEDGEGSPWLMVEPDDWKNLPFIGDGFLGLDLPDGTTYERAKEMAKSLNEEITALSHSWFLSQHLQDKPF